MKLFLFAPKLVSMNAASSVDMTSLYLIVHQQIELNRK